MHVSIHSFILMNFNRIAKKKKKKQKLQLSKLRSCRTGPRCERKGDREKHLDKEKKEKEPKREEKGENDDSFKL